MRSCHGSRRCAAVHLARRLSRVHRAASTLLAVTRRDADLLRVAHAGGEGVAAAQPLDLINAVKPKGWPLYLGLGLAHGQYRCAPKF